MAAAAPYRLQGVQSECLDGFAIRTTSSAQAYLPGLTMPAGHTLTDINDRDEIAKQVEQAYVEVGQLVAVVELIVLIAIQRTCSNMLHCTLAFVCEVANMINPAGCVACFNCRCAAFLAWFLGPERQNSSSMTCKILCHAVVPTTCVLPPRVHHRYSMTTG